LDLVTAMPFKVKLEPWEGPAMERCCFCRTRTKYWHPKKDVAVCPDCAKVRKVSEIPTKEEWWTTEAARGTEFGAIIVRGPHPILAEGSCNVCPGEAEAVMEVPTGRNTGMSLRFCQAHRKILQELLGRFDRKLKPLPIGYTYER
jgi:hypothetical protein